MAHVFELLILKDITFLNHDFSHSTGLDIINTHFFDLPEMNLMELLSLVTYIIALPLLFSNIEVLTTYNTVFLDY